jgi:phosphoribosylformimino-5-aminoimidazole carboxamide ribotide isomerase
MEILPAIDLRHGRCVRLLQGRADEETVYADDPVAMALHWVREGATRLHVVDLDGAFTGKPVHRPVIGHIASSVPVPVQTGGGLRTDDDLERMLAEGVDRVILGTRACREPGSMRALVDRFGDRLAVGIDARDGKVQIQGWTETTERDASDLAKELEGAGIRTLIYTDTSRDGMLQGVNARAVEALCHAVSCDVIASGGVHTARDVEALVSLDAPNLKGVIVGKTLYEKNASLGELIEAGRKAP